MEADRSAATGSLSHKARQCDRQHPHLPHAWGEDYGCMGVPEDSAATRYRMTVIFEAENDADALRQEDKAYEVFDSVIDQHLETEDGRQL